MNRVEMITGIESFKNKIIRLKNILLESRDCVGDIVDNHDKIQKLRTELNQEYAKLEKFIYKFGNKPHMNDGVWSINYPAYNNALSNDILQRVGPSLDAVIQDLDYIKGKISALNNKEFDKSIKEKINNIQIADRWNYINPFWLIWKFIIFLWENKIITSITVGLIVAYFTWKFGWLK